MTLRHEVMGWFRGRCHVARTQLQPSWEWPDAGPRPKDSMEALDWEYWQRVPFRTALGIHAPLMQCLYEDGQAASVMERVRGGRGPAASWPVSE